MDIVKLIVASEQEAQQMALDFKKEHAKQSPIVEIFKDGSVVVYDFIKENRSFNCKYRVIGWKKGLTYDDAQIKLENDRERIKKEYNGEPKEFYSWDSKSTGYKKGISFFIKGVSIELKKQSEGKLYGTWIAKIGNPDKEKAAYVVFLVDGVRNPSNSKNPFKVQPGMTMTINLGKAVEVDVLLAYGEKEEEEEPGIIKQIMNYTGRKIREENGKLVNKGATYGVRG